MIKINSKLIALVIISLTTFVGIDWLSNFAINLNHYENFSFQNKAATIISWFFFYVILALIISSILACAASYKEPNLDKRFWKWVLTLGLNYTNLLFILFIYALKLLPLLPQLNQSILSYSLLFILCFIVFVWFSFIYFTISKPKFLQ